MSKRVVAVLLTLALSACAAAPSHDHQLRMTLPVDPTSLSPLIAFAQDQIALDQFWCQTLVGLDEHNRFTPILVTRIPTRQNGDISADGTWITYHLRRDALFADGVPLTSADVAFTYRAILEPANRAPSIEDYERIAALTTPDRHTVKVRLRKPWSAAVHVLFAQADEAYGILPRHAFTDTKTIGSRWDQKPFGTGPFRVAAWKRGEGIELEPNPYYRPKPKLSRIVVRIVPNQTSAFALLQTHEVDVTELNPDNVKEAETLDDLRVMRTAENGLRALYVQTTAQPTNDIHVRRAIAYALDRRELSKAWRDLYPAARSLFPAALVSWAATRPPPYAYDPARAGREFDAAGWHLHGNVRMRNGQPLTMLGAIDSTIPVIGRIAVVVQQQLALVGVDATIKSYTSTVFSSPDGPLRTGRFTFTPGTLIGGSDPEQSINVVCAKAHNGGGNYSRFCSARLEMLFNKQMNATNETERNRDFDAIANLVHDEVPLIPLYDLLYIEGINKRVTGYTRNMLRYAVRPENWDAL